MSSDFDVIIVGSGPSGVSAAFPLVKSGLSVLMVDGGRQANITLPTQSFLESRADDENQWKWMIGKDFHALKMQGAVSPKLRVPTHGYVFEGFEAANSIVSKDFIAVGSLARGGLSNAWGCGVACLSVSELSEFPFKAKEIERSYEEVTKRIGVSGRHADDLTPYFGLDDWAQPPIKMDALNNHLYDQYTSCRANLVEMGFRLGRTRTAVLSADYDERQACDRSGNCLWGCNRHAMYTALDELTILRKFDNFHYKDGFIVDRVTSEPGNCTIEGQSIVARVQSKFTANKILLAAGTLATTKIVLKSLKLNQQVPLLSCPTAAFLLWIPRMFGISRKQSFGLGQLSFTIALQRGINGFGTTLSTTGIPVSEFARYVPLTRRFSLDILESILTSCLVGNIFLPGNLTSAFANLKANGSLHISGGYHGHVAALMDEAEKKLRKTFWKMGAILLPKSFSVGSPGGDIHYSGTLPMRSKPAIGETNSEGEVVGLEGVHVIDGACLPTLSEKSHTLTIMANADRIARKLAK